MCEAGKALYYRPIVQQYMTRWRHTLRGGIRGCPKPRRIVKCIARAGEMLSWRAASRPAPMISSLAYGGIAEGMLSSSGRYVTRRA